MALGGAMHRPKKGPVREENMKVAAFGVRDINRAAAIYGDTRGVANPRILE